MTPLWKVVAAAPTATAAAAAVIILLLLITMSATSGQKIVLDINFDDLADAVQVVNDTNSTHVKRWRDTMYYETHQHERYVANHPPPYPSYYYYYN